ncbi:hypothetical protein [Microbispora sp. KK1-11]|uniref:hypothetical protein n=1 Tax=Microbispora sp. KK1-11 TaxID=2053005 RepID=UPI001C8DA7F9|nr:hypothetical protein [Microbispora sp. KK1-11]
MTGLFAGSNTCVLTPATTQGPYYFDADKIRSDIREDRQGRRLKVAVKVQDSEKCAPPRSRTRTASRSSLSASRRVSPH